METKQLLKGITLVMLGLVLGMLVGGGIAQYQGGNALKEQQAIYESDMNDTITRCSTIVSDLNQELVTQADEMIELQNRNIAEVQGSYELGRQSAFMDVVASASQQPIDVKDNKGGVVTCIGDNVLSQMGLKR